MKPKLRLKLPWLLLLFVVFAGLNPSQGQTNRILNNNRLRVGNGTENSINNSGNMQQPFYFNGTTWQKLTFSTFPLDIAWGIGGDGTSGWNTSGTIVQNPIFSNQAFDFSGFTITNPTTGEGFGQIRTTGEITLGGQLFRVENLFELLQPEGYIAIKVKITNISGSNATNVRLWVGTRDDFVGGSDVPTKERGNLINEEFVRNTNMADQAKAIKISTAQEAILFFSNSDRAFSTISGCCSFSNAYLQNPATNAITTTGDGSYALYVRFNDLGVNQSDELIWYYGAGTLPEIDEIITRVASAAIGAFDNITYNSADYAATTVQPGTGYWLAVPQGSTPPTETQIEAGVNYGGVTLAAAGNAAMLANQEHVFHLSNLEALTTYDFYFVSKFFDGVNDAYTEVISETLTTKEAPPVIADFNPKSAAHGETITVTGANFSTTSNVAIGTHNALFSVVDANTLEVTVPNGATDFYITVTNESGSHTLQSEITGNTDAPCTTGWGGAWQTISTVTTGALRTVTLQLENTNATNSYDLWLELHETDNDPASANPAQKFNSLLEASEIITVPANTVQSDFSFTFTAGTVLQENTNYYVVLKESPSNPPITGEQGISMRCSTSGTTDGGAGNNFGTLYHSFTMSPVLEISNPPTGISLSPNAIQENNTVNQLVGVLSTIDADPGDTHAYALVAGAGDTDNTHFSIDGVNLLAATIFDFETKTSYSIRVRTIDSDNNIFEAIITISVTNEVDEDFDSDGILDSVDNCPSHANTDQADLDGDAIGDACDPDIDGDGVPNDEDAFPTDPNEDTDTDGDGSGDNADTDDDNDGTPDGEDAFPTDPNEDTDTDGDGSGDNADTDDDNDGTPDGEDAFPTDPNEDTDTDGDGSGDNADTDDDNDGTPDGEDAFPTDPNEDTDTDGDGSGDNADTDDDNDGTPDGEDAFPTDPNEDTDTDGDGSGDNADTDDDNDGTPDGEDAFPTDPNEDTDTDGDGSGDNADTDDDNDGTPDGEDAFPTDPNEDTDTDGDGSGDNADTDIDGDGIPNDDDQFPFSAVADSDNDGVPDEEDTFPNDTDEFEDTDGDGIGDNADPDDDNDGFTDAVEITEGTDAKNASHFPLDTDGDGMPDSQDPDMDGDGIPNGSDAFPLAATPVLVPAQAFTPGGDGINDTWVVPGIDNYPNNVVRVYNRWGHEVFASQGYQNDWGGNHNGNSSLLPPGSYLYVIDLGNGTAPLQGWLFINY